MVNVYSIYHEGGGTQGIYMGSDFVTVPQLSVVTPTFNPDGGAHPGSSVDVRITCATPGATIRYTTNGSDPTTSSPTVISGSSVTVPLPGTLMAKAWKDGMTESEMKSALYTSNDPGQEGDYMVIDLSAGPSASSYSVSYMSAVPAGGWSDEYKTTKLVMRRIPAGTFTMGSPSGELGRESDETEHQVTLTKDFYIGVFPVTQKQWERVMGDWPSYFHNPDYRDSRPVDFVSYYVIRENPNNSTISPNWPQSAQAHENSFIGKLREKTWVMSLDLPTEAQWEYACRAGTTTALNSGKNLTAEDSCPNLLEVGRYRWSHPGGVLPSSDVDTDGGTAKVGSYLPNAWGLYDMHGNVFEWCLDWYAETPQGTTDPVGAASGASQQFSLWSISANFKGKTKPMPARGCKGRPGILEGAWMFSAA
jgi:formylglycine-generating enzyme required for sulfatase activity